MTQTDVVRDQMGMSPVTVPVAEIKRGDVFQLLSLEDREVFARVHIVEPPVNHEQMWRVWIAPVFRGDEVQSRMSFDACESVEVWR